MSSLTAKPVAGFKLKTAQFLNSIVGPNRSSVGDPMPKTQLDKKNLLEIASVMRVGPLWAKGLGNGSHKAIRGAP